jgi:hypothetical protein
MAISRTAKAVRRVQAGEKVQEVARALEISASAIYAQIKREAGVKRCPCCGQVVREGYKVDRRVLKATSNVKNSKPAS